MERNNEMIILMRGLPGSGKSTTAEEIVNVNDNFVIVSADNFFINSDGEYIFDHKKIGDAHKWCRDQAEYSIRNGLNVVVDNTNTTKWEMEPYLNIADKYLVKLYVYHVPFDDVDVCAERNTHGVPRETIQKMKDRFEHLDDFDPLYPSLTTIP